MRSVYYVASLSILLFTSIVLAAPPTITGPEKVYAEAGDWAEIKVDSSGKWVKFRPIDSGLKMFPADKLKDNKSTLVNGKPGKQYRVLAYTGNDEAGAEIEILVVFGSGPFPNPSPDPTPTPVPPVPNTIEDFWIVIVEETSKRSTDTAALLGNIVFWKSLPGGHTILLYDKDSPDAKKWKYDVMAKQTDINLPVLMLVDSEGKLIKAQALPNDTASIKKFIKENTGK